MLSRRLLLGGAAGVALTALGGCGVLEPGGAPPASAPNPSVPGHAALAALRIRLDAAASADLTAAQTDLIAWAHGVNDEQHAATSLAVPSARGTTADPSGGASADPSGRASADPSGRASADPSGAASAGPAGTPGASGDPAAGPAGSTTTPSAPDAAKALAALEDALDEASAAFTAQALDASTARPLTWASMAAWCAALRTQLPRPSATREPARGVLRPAPQSAGEAFQAALDAANAALYGLQVAAGHPGLSAENRARLAARMTFWTNLRDTLDALARATSATPSPAPPWFEVARPASAEEAIAMVARLQAAALPILGRSLAHGDHALRQPLAAALADLAVDIPRWGGLLERWPGLPST
ncbi:MAG: DUF4439 domain-containing protein [Propioniciclava sp.]|uniref:DUF4439 domain-containing protein n=1 Tax=Propioniciclava sp. TaxID=2038686 RepID=UPI0039E2DC56